MEKGAYSVVSYQGKVLGYMHGKNGNQRFEPALDELETLDYLETLDPRVLVHLPSLAPAVHRLVRHHGLRPSDYRDESTIVLCVADEDVHSRTELFRKDNIAWRLVHRCHLEDKLFPQLQPA